MSEPKAASVQIFVLLAVLILGGGAIYFVYFGSAGEAYVSGTVTEDNKAVGRAKLAFFRIDKSESPVLTQSDEQGRFQVVGNYGGGISPGKYRVTASKLALKDGTVPAGEALTQAIANGTLVNHLAKEYEDDKKSPLEFEIKPGSQTIRLAVKSKR